MSIYFNFVFAFNKAYPLHVEWIHKDYYHSMYMITHNSTATNLLGCNIASGFSVCFACRYFALLAKEMPVLWDQWNKLYKYNSI